MDAQIESTFLPVSLNWRSVSELELEIGWSANGGSTESARRQTAQIELLIREGDQLYRRRQYEQALRKYKEARALIYRLIQPRFEPGPWVRSTVDLALPLSPSIEKALTGVALHLADAIRPVAEAGKLVYPAEMTEIPDELQRYANAGFQEKRSLDEILQNAVVNGASLLLDDKPAAAITVLENAHRQGEQARDVDQSQLAALRLNLAAAHLQAGDAGRAVELSELAVETFRAREDVVGEAQGFHTAGVAAKELGDERRAQQYFEAAQKALSRSGGASERRESPPRGTVTVNPTLRPTRGLEITRPLLEVVPFVSARVDLRDSLPATRDLDQLQDTIGKDFGALTYRISGRADGWGVFRASGKLQREQRDKAWQVTVLAGRQPVSFEVGGGQLANLDQLTRSLYQVRTEAMRFADLAVEVIDGSTTSFYLTHIYGYVLPVKIADAYHALGHFQNAETNYQQAASYSFLNRRLEATSLWIRLARNALQWGVSHYKAERIEQARTQFEKIVTTGGQTSNSFLYTTASLQIPADQARTLITGLSNRPLPVIHRSISRIILEAYDHLANIAAGFDYYGLLLSPIHTFEYLQGVARSFCNEAIQAEREFVNFKSRQELEAATRRDLENSIAMAQSEAEVREQLVQAARADERAAAEAVQLATRRRDDAVAERQQYAAASATQIWAQAASQAQLGGSDSWYSEISELADRLDRGESISGERGKLAAAYVLQAGRKTREYELDKMQDTIDQLTQAITVAQQQLDSARHRTNATEIAWQAALQQVALAQQSLEAFDAEFFTPDAWEEMAEVMRNISRSYLDRAIRIAKLMERAYNFENDENLKVIKNEYGHGIANEAPGRDTRLLAGDALLVDIDSFTYHSTTHTTRKSSRIKDVISLASAYPAQFERFLETGLLSFETDLYEFDRQHPGFYEQRIEAVELEIVGLLADTPLNGTLRAGGVTRFRRRNNTVGSRTHSVDTLAISEFKLRNDVFLYSVDTGVRGLFQGLGLGSTWELHLPRRSNDFDLRRIFDVRLIFYYKAKFDPGLRSTVLALPPRTGEFVVQRNFAMRFDFPAAWYAFYKSGRVDFDLRLERFPANQRDFQTQAVRFRVRPREGGTAGGIDLRITAPGGASITATTNTEGIVSTDDPALAALAGIAPIGVWSVEAMGGAPLESNGSLDFRRIDNLQLSIDYSFEYLSEVI